MGIAFLVIFIFFFFHCPLYSIFFLNKLEIFDKIIDKFIKHRSFKKNTAKKREWKENIFLILWD